MTFMIDGALAAVFAAVFLCASGAAARADAVADGKDHRAHVKREAHAVTAVPRTTSYPQYRAVFWQPFGWGAPPLQDKRDAYQGYFANPLDNPRYYGTGRATLIFR